MATTTSGGTDHSLPYDEMAQGRTTNALSQPSSILSRCKACLSLFESNCKSLQQSEEADGKPQNAIFDIVECLALTQDGRVRFKAWASSIGALHGENLQSSLDFRLKEAKRIRERVLKVLQHLEASLQEIFLIVSGQKENEIWAVDTSPSTESVDEDNSDNRFKLKDRSSAKPEHSSDLHELLSDVKRAVSNLMKLSMIIRSSPTRDDYRKAASRYSFDPQYDIGHLKEKYGSSRYSEAWLLERLGKAITLRRQYLKYRQEHYQKIARDWDEKEAKADHEDHKTVVKTLALTKATTFVESPVEFVREDIVIAEPTGSQTSYEATTLGDTAMKTRVVPPHPEMAFPGIHFEFGEPFLCPYCRTEQTVTNRNAWKRHVYRDLKPYVCTFKECYLKMFRSRHEWFAHELQMHRREWTCQYCKHKPFLSAAAFSSHLNTKHQKQATASSITALVKMCEEPVDRVLPNACHLCNEWDESLLSSLVGPDTVSMNQEIRSGTIGRFRKHLGRHMEQLALFALPKVDGEEESDSKSQGSSENGDDRSDISGEGLERGPIEASRKDGVDEPLDKVEVHQAQALESRRVKLGERHPDTIIAMSSLALTWRAQDRYVEAEPLQAQVLELWKSVHGEKHPDTIHAMDSLASTWQAQGRYDEAEPLQAQVLELRKSVLGKRHPNTIIAMSSLASTWQAQDRYDKAEPLQAQVLELRKSVLGTKHPDTIIAMESLALIWQTQGRYDEAEPLQAQMLELCKSVLGEKHLNTIHAMSNLAWIWHTQGRYDEAETLEAQVLELQKSVLGEKRPEIIKRP